MQVNVIRVMQKLWTRQEVIECNTIYEVLEKRGSKKVLFMHEERLKANTIHLFVIMVSSPFFLVILPLQILSWLDRFLMRFCQGREPLASQSTPNEH